MLVFVLTFVVMLAFQPLLKKYFPQPATPQQQNQSAPTQAAATTLATPVASAAATPASTATKQASSETETVIENDLYRITFTNRGAQVKSWILKKFDNDAQNGPLDLVNAAAAEKFGYPLSLWTYDEGLHSKLSSALYVASREGKQTSPTTITFEYADQDVSVRKTFSFDDSYTVTVATSVTSKGSDVAALPGVAFRVRQPDHTRLLRVRQHRLPVQQKHRAPAHPVRIHDHFEMHRHQRRPDDQRTVPLGWRD